MNPLLSVNSLQVILSEQLILKAVSMEVHPDEIRGVIGPNGAGKTTLLNAITGFVPIARGDVLVGGKRISARGPNQFANAGVRRTFQHPQLFRTLTPAQHLIAVVDNGATGNVMALKELAWELVGVMPDKPAELLDLIDLRILEVARAVVAAPGVLLLDEPAAGLDSAERGRLSDLVREVGSLGVGVVVIEHDMALVNRLCDVLTVLDAGEVIADGPTATVFRKEEIVQAYLGGVDVANSD